MTPEAIAEADLATLQAAQRDGRLDARALVTAQLRRIDALDGALRALIEINPEALAIASELDAARAAGEVRGPLHGIPVLLKDNIDTADGMHTSAGSLALAGQLARRDAGLVERLRSAGAILLGKTNLSEWANFRGHRSSSGWSARGGQCRNPYALERSPSGSSSGSAAAVAAGYCALAVGTETDGSIVSPAAACGVVGIKPTVGLVSRSGIIPISASQDTAGPLARSVADAARLLAAMAGPDPRDPASAVAGERGQADYRACLDPAGLAGARLGVLRAAQGDHRQLAPVFERTLSLLRAAGAELVDPIEVPSAGHLERPELERLLYEFKDGLNRYLSQAGPGAAVSSLAELIAFNRTEADRELGGFGQELLEAAQAKGDLSSPAYLAATAEAGRLAGAEGIDAVLAEHRLDAIVAPTSQAPAWLIDPLNGDSHAGDCSSLAAVAGYPHLSLPMGLAGGLPLGLSFFAGAWSEPTLIRLAHAYERARGPYPKPALALLVRG